MSNWSSFEKDKLLTESWRQYLEEDPELRRLEEDLNRELETLDELFGFGDAAPVPEKWRRIAAGEDEDEEEPEKKRGFFAKMKDYYKGIKDISGFFGKGAGTLLGGEETFDMKKRKELKDNALSEINKWVKQLNYAPVTVLYSKLSKAQFPNNDKGAFNQQRDLIEKAYDTVVADHNAKKIPTKQANLIIAVLRGMVIYFQDFAMADRYFYINEAEEEEQAQMGREQGAVSKSYKAAYGATLPLALMAGGAVLGAMGFAANSQWFQEALSGLKDLKDASPDAITNTVAEQMVPTDLGDVKDGEGIIKVVRRLIPGQEQFATTANPGDLSVLLKPENNATLQLIRQSMGAEGGNVALFDKLLKNPAGSALETFIQGPMSGTATSNFPLGSGSFTKVLKTQVKKQVQKAAKLPAKTLKNAFLSGLGTFAGPILQALGLSTAIAGAALGAGRFKGKRSSRQSTLKTLVDLMVDVVGEEEEEPVGPEDCKEVIAKLVGQFKSGMLVRYIEEKEFGNVTGMEPARGQGGFGGESLITKIIEMPGEGNTPSVEEQMKTDEWKKEKVIFVQVQGMASLEAGQRKGNTNSFPAAGIRNCKLNFSIPDDDDKLAAWRSDPKTAKRMGIEKPEGAGMADLTAGKVTVYYEDFVKEAVKRGVPRNITKHAFLALMRAAKETGSPQNFQQRGKRKRTDPDKATTKAELREEVSQFIEIGTFWSKLFRKFPDQADPRTPEGLKLVKSLTRAAIEAGALIGLKGKKLGKGQLKALKPKSKKGAATAAGGAEEKCEPGYTRNKQGACVPFGTPGINEALARWHKLAGIIKG
jgi:hypothetical protein